MEFSITKNILAAVTVDPSRVGGGVPIFYANNREEQEKISTYLARITAGVVHDLENGVYILVRH